jgi:hypothetical protein
VEEGKMGRRFKTEEKRAMKWTNEGEKERRKR